MAENKGEEKIGHVVEVIGPVVDILFQEHHLPHIHYAVRITSEGFDVPEPLDIVAEVAQHMGEGRVRCVAMKPTEGLVRGMKAENLGEPISVPVGRATLGRVLNVLGEPVDKLLERLPGAPTCHAAEQACIQPGGHDAQRPELAGDRPVVDGWRRFRNRRRILWD